MKFPETSLKMHLTGTMCMVIKVNLRSGFFKYELTKHILHPNLAINILLPTEGWLSYFSPPIKIPDSFFWRIIITFIGATSNLSKWILVSLPISGFLCFKFYSNEFPWVLRPRTILQNFLAHHHLIFAFSSFRALTFMFR